MNTYAQSQLSLRSAESQLERERRQQKQYLLASPVIQQQQALELALAEAKGSASILQPVASSAAIVAEVLVKEGDWVNESAPIFLLTQRKKPLIQAFLDARHAEYAVDGTAATVIFPSGEKVKGQVTGQTVLASRLPLGMAKPFDQDKSALKVRIAILEIPQTPLIENLPVQIQFSGLLGYDFAALNNFFKVAK